MSVLYLYFFGALSARSIPNANLFENHGRALKFRWRFGIPSGATSSQRSLFPFVSFVALYNIRERSYAGGFWGSDLSLKPTKKAEGPKAPTPTPQAWVELPTITFRMIGRESFSERQHRHRAALTTVSSQRRAV